MKKVISLILTIAIVVSTFSVTVLADSIELEMIEKPEKYIEPCYGDYEIVDEGVNVLASKGDAYESNNSFKKATLLTPTSSGAPQSDNYYVYGTIHQESWMFGLIEKDIDEDYYRFDVMGEASVTISLTNIPVGSDYDMKIYMFDNIKYSEDTNISQIASSSQVGVNPEIVTKILQPGTYYVWIYSYNENFDENKQYKIDVDISYTANNEHVSELRFNKGARAALWISDFDPCGILPYSEYGSVVEIGSEGIAGANNKFANPFYSYITNPNGVDHAILYIWDEELRAELYEAVEDIIDGLEVELAEEKEDAKVDVITEYVTKIGATGASVIGTIISVAKFGGPKVQLITTGVTALINMIGLAVSPPEGTWSVTKHDLMSYYYNLRTALESSNGLSDEVIKIVTKYYYVEDGGLFSTSHTLSFVPTVQSSYLHLSDVLPAWTSNSVVNGKVYGINDSFDSMCAVSRIDYDLIDVNTSEIYELTLNNGEQGDLRNGEYHWYKFAVPYTGRYVFYADSGYNTVGELFYSVVPARGQGGMIASDDSTGVDGNFSIEVLLQGGDTVYLRIREKNWSVVNNYNIQVTMIDILSEE